VWLQHRTFDAAEGVAAAVAVVVVAAEEEVGVDPRYSVVSYSP
jgi:hypothetical protein